MKRNEDGTFAIGPGRKKGSKNKTTQVQKHKLMALAEKIETEYLEEDLKKLQPSERIKAYLSIQEYLIPKLQRVERELTEGEEILLMTSQERAAYKERLLAETSKKKRHGHRS